MVLAPDHRAPSRALAWESLRIWESEEGRVPGEGGTDADPARESERHVGAHTLESLAWLRLVLALLLGRVLEEGDSAHGTVPRIPFPEFQYPLLSPFSHSLFPLASATCHIPAFLFPPLFPLPVPSLPALLSPPSHPPWRSVPNLRIPHNTLAGALSPTLSPPLSSPQQTRPQSSATLACAKRRRPRSVARTSTDCSGMTRKAAAERRRSRSSSSARARAERARPSNVSLPRSYLPRLEAVSARGIPCAPLYLDPLYSHLSPTVSPPRTLGPGPYKVCGQLR